MKSNKCLSGKHLMVAERGVDGEAMDEEEDRIESLKQQKAKDDGVKTLHLLSHSIFLAFQP